MNFIIASHVDVSEIRNANRIVIGRPKAATEIRYRRKDDIKLVFSKSFLGARPF
jgi:hypothetical protein